MLKKYLISLFLIFVCSISAQKSKSSVWIGELFQVQFDDQEKAIQLGNKVLSEPTSTLTEQSYALIGIGTSYSIKGKTSEAIPFLIKAIQTAEKTNNFELRTNSNLALANLYNKMNLYEQANNYILKAQKEALNEPDEIAKNHVSMRIATQLGENLNLQKKYPEALKSFENALQFAKKYDGLKDKSSSAPEFAMIYTSIGETYYFDQQWDNAEQAFEKALTFSENDVQKKNYQKAYNYGYLGKIYFHRKELNRAVDTLQAASKINDNKNSYIQAEIYYTLAQAYQKLKKPDLYSEYNELHLKLRDEISEDEKKALAESIKNEIRIAEEQNQAKKKNQLLYLGIIGLLIGIGAFVIIRLQKKKKEEKILYLKTIEKLESSLLEKPEPQPEVVINDLPKEKRTPIFVAEETEVKLLKKLEKFEKSESYLNPKISLAVLATQFDTNSSYISEVINSSKNKNFNQYINELRIDYICRKIHDDPVYQNYKISHLAEISGFSSHTVFAKVFKKNTGISPSVFIDLAREQLIQ